MPTYDYRCTKCGHLFELFHGIRDDGPKRCPKCKGRARRVPAGGAGILFKGSGFYITDYRSDSYKKAAKKEHEGGKKGDGGSSGGSSTGGSTGKTDASARAGRRQGGAPGTVSGDK